MTTRDYRELRDKSRGLNRKKIYGSSRGHFPLPYQTATRTSKAKIGSPNYDTKNYDNKQNVSKMLAMF